MIERRARISSACGCKQAVHQRGAKMFTRQATKNDQKKAGVRLLVIKDEVWLQCERCGARWRPHGKPQKNSTCLYGCRI